MAERTWFITGVSRGLGRQMAELLLERGDRVAGTARSVAAVVDLKARYGDWVWLVALDLTDGLAIGRVVDEAFAALGRIDVVVNNAGYGLFGAAEEVTAEQVVHQIQTNLIGSIEVIRAALPHLRNQGGGRVIQVSSAGGQITYPGFSLYHATKWGIEGFVETVAQEVAPFGIGFTIAEMGATRTEFGDSMIRPAMLSAYEDTPVDQVRRAVATGAFPILGDPVRVVQAMIDSVDRSPAPLRLALGRDAYEGISQALAGRLAALEAQRELALSTDFPA